MRWFYFILFSFLSLSISAQNRVNGDWTYDGLRPIYRFTLPGDTLANALPKSMAIASDGCIYVRTGCGTPWRKVWCDSTAITSTLAISSQPTSRTVNVGDNTTFTVGVTGGTTPYAYQWQKVSTNISGATSNPYTKTSVTVSDSGNFRVVVTDAALNTVTSNYAHLTVVAAITFTYGYSASDPYVNNSTAPTISNPTTTTITTGANVVFNLPAIAADKFWVVKELASEPIKTAWYHNTDNSGPIPGDVVRTWTVGLYRYYSSVMEFVLTYTDSIQLTH